MNQIRWTERTFRFDFPAGLYPELIERLRGTPARISDRLTGIAPHRLDRRRENAWSILENIGHLADLDDGLFLVRLDEFQRGVESLQPADMTNRMTEAANHNAKSLEKILADFRRARAGLVARLEACDPSLFSRSAFHPRLKVQMRLADLMFFQAEHDDHHLATISEILRSA
jgi:uncharacterized damage-inducible protein DinB